MKALFGKIDGIKSLFGVAMTAKRMVTVVIFRLPRQGTSVKIGTKVDIDLDRFRKLGWFDYGGTRFYLSNIEFV